MPEFAGLVQKSKDIERAAIVVDVREGQALDRLPDIIKRVKRVLPTRVVFLDAQDSVLVRRYSETRRPHPLQAVPRPCRVRLWKSGRCSIPFATSPIR